MLQRILVWDAPTRVFHWLNALAFGGAYLTAYSERHRDIHLAAGYIMLGLIVFRLLWGFIGTRHARFGSFLFSPAAIYSYLVSMLKRNARHMVGHTPVGSVAIWLLLSLCIFLGVTGILALQDDASDLVVDMHGIATNVTLAVIGLHLAGVAVSSLLHRENLVRAMITGYKTGETDQAIPLTYTWLGTLILAAVIVFWFVYLKNPLG